MKADKFIEYDLEYLVIKKMGKEVNSFRIIPKETDATKEAIKLAKRTDGLWIIVTNNTGKEKEGKKLTEEDLISAYRDKNQIEQAFKDVKSFIKIQPCQQRCRIPHFQRSKFPHPVIKFPPNFQIF